MTDKTSFLKLKDWVSELQTVLGNDLLIAVACNKCDLSSRREVSMEQAQDFAASMGAMLFETSAKTNQGVEELFLDLSAKLLQRAEGAPQPRTRFLPSPLRRLLGVFLLPPPPLQRLKSRAPRASRLQSRRLPRKKAAARRPNVTVKIDLEFL